MKYSFLVVTMAAPLALQAQAPKWEPFRIADNSFLVEEAFNQEAGIFQNIFLFSRGRGSGDWGLEFTQEWPVRSQQHQFSFTVPIERGFDGIGDIMLNWRVQALTEELNLVAFSPRLSVVLPTGDDSSFKYGAQLNLPVSRQQGDVYLHANAGASLNRLELLFVDASGAISEEMRSLVSPWLSGSVIWRALPMVHPMLETVASFDQIITGANDKDYENSWLISPGVRAGLNMGTRQLVGGIAVPLRITGSDPEASLRLYLSYELPFR